MKKIKSLFKAIRDNNYVQLVYSYFMVVVSIVLAVVLCPMSLIVGIIYYIPTLKFQSGIDALGIFLVRVSFAINQLSNVLAGPFLNLLLVREGGTKFGSHRDTISFVMAYNFRNNTLRLFGRGIYYVVTFFVSYHYDKALDLKISEDLICYKRLHADKYYGKNQADNG